MYWLMSIDAVVRIAIGMTVLFVVVPALALPSRRDAPLLDRFFWNFGVVVIFITLGGQILTLANLFSRVTLLVTVVVLLILRRAAVAQVTPWSLVRRWSETAFLAVLNVFEGKINLRRRLRRRYRRAIASIQEKTRPRQVRLQIMGWAGLATVAAAFRFYRAFASANLGYSDTYVHLYLLKLLGEGRQVDPDFGPYPRGMHFVLQAIQQITNVDEILLMNYFGAFAGVLITLGVAHAARTLSGSLTGGLLAGLLFATLVGGPRQYFVLGGGISTASPNEARAFLAQPYDRISGGGEFDLALTAFHRQTSTLSQELAMAMLFPAAIFLLAFLRRRDRWHLAGYAGCTASIAAVHSGVLIPLAAMTAIALVAVMFEGAMTRESFRRATIAGLLAAIIGSSWALGFLVFPYVGGEAASSDGSVSVLTAVLYYFPFLRSFAPAGVGGPQIAAARVFVGMTPFLLMTLVLALGILGLARTHVGERRGNQLWIGAIFLLFLLSHFASTLDLLVIVETTRNSQWLLMAAAVLIGVSTAELGSLLERRTNLGWAAGIAAAAVMLLWASRVPLPSAPAIRERIVNYSGYGASTLAVLRIDRRFEPYTWTLVSYGQEFPMVLKRGFHLAASDFVERYDPAEPVLRVPTRHVFIIVEKMPHSFEINAWARRFDRAEVEQRLQAWVFLYQASHSDVSVFLEDENVRVYQIERSQRDIDFLAQRTGG